MSEMVILCSSEPDKVNALLKTNLSIYELVEVFNCGNHKQRTEALEKLKNTTGTLEDWINIYKNNRSNTLLPIASKKINYFMDLITDFDELTKTFDKCSRHKLTTLENMIAKYIVFYPATLDELVVYYQKKDLPRDINIILLNRIRYELSHITNKNQVQRYIGMHLSHTLSKIVHKRLSELS